MIVIADSGPLHYLISLGQVGLLHKFYDEVFVPSAVMAELSHANAPLMVRQCLQMKPTWLKEMPCDIINPKFGNLGLGERQALSLAALTPNSFLLVDDGAARIAASREKIKFSGTLGVLPDAAINGLVDIEPMIDELRQETNFHGSAKLYRDVIENVQRRLAAKSK